MNEKLNLPVINKNIADFWEKNNIYEKSQEDAKDCPEFVFYDGPPFATGTPHYGHILASVLKDIIPRYKTQTGFFVKRQWNWDTHGLPIEYEIEKELGIKTKQEILKLGIPKYNHKCREIVMRYTEEWGYMIKNIGRWIDWKNNVKSMDFGYMKSVWWVFKQLFDLNLIYEGFKVMPFSTACHTPLSNFEAQQAYKTVEDYSLVVKFRLVEYPKISFLVWTTTPWTLSANLAICLSSKLNYVLISENSTDNLYILAEECVSTYFKKENEYQKVCNFSQKDLEGVKYEPMYSIYQHEYHHAFKVLYDDYVSSDKGTGCVHQAPAFGQDDYRVGLKFDLIDKNKKPPCPIDVNGIFTLTEYAGIYIKDAEKSIVKELKNRHLVFKVDRQKHEYPFCWRSDTPLIYMAVPAWFMKVEHMRDRMVELNSKVNWIPTEIGENRFGNWLKTAPDWCIGRNRYWGTPLPIWANEKEQYVPSSVEELEERAGLEKGSITDLHIDQIGHITIPSKKGNTSLKLIKLTFDCWFESGSLPFAQNYYTGNNNSPPNFPADFIAEGLDQTRGWFYTLLVLSTALYDCAPYKNVIVNGLVLAEDGKKMSKSLKNYPEVNEIFDLFGADVLRFYLIDGDLVQAEPLKFAKKGLQKLTQVFFIPYHNSIKFLSEFSHQNNNIKNNNDYDELDKLLLTYTNELFGNIHFDMNEYKLNKIVLYCTQFIDFVSRVYIKLKKPKIKIGSSVKILFDVLWNLTVMLSPFIPFITEHYYQCFFKSKLQTNCVKESIHFYQLPVTDLPLQLVQFYQPQLLMSDIKLSMKNVKFSGDYLKKLLLLGHNMRGKLPFSYKRPLKNLEIKSTSNVIKCLEKYKEIIINEFNLMDLTFAVQNNQSSEVKIKVNFKEFNKKHKNLTKSIAKFVQNKDNHLVINQSLRTNKFYLFENVKIVEEYFLIEQQLNQNDSNTYRSEDFVLVPNLEYTEEIAYLHHLRQMTRAVNEDRKQRGMTNSTECKGFLHTTNKVFLIQIDRFFDDLFVNTKVIFDQHLDSIKLSDEVPEIETSFIIL